MSVLTDSYVRVRPDTTGFGSQVNRELSKVDAAPAGRKAGGTFTAGLKSGLSGISAVAKGAFATIATGAVAAGGFGLKIASQNEQAQISFETMLGSAQKAGVFLKDLQSFAAKTPFEFPELQTAASSLISAGVEASKVIPIMTSLGNATSGMGTGSEGVKRATVAIQQMNAAGRITAEDLNQLRDAGLPVYDLLAAATGKSKKEVAGLAAAGRLGAKELDQLMKALESGKGLERFSGLMDKQSESLAGMVSTFKDAFGQGLASAIAPALPTIKKGLGEVSAQAEHFFAVLSGKGKAADFVTTAGQLALGLRGLVAGFKEGDVTSGGFVGKMQRVGVVAREVFDYIRGTAIPGIKALYDSFRSGGADTDAVGESFSSIGDSLKKIGPALQGASTSMPSFTDSISVGAKVLEFFADNIDTVVKYMPLIVAGLVAYKVAQLAANVAQVIAVPTKIAEVVVNRQLVRSNQQLIASRIGLTATTATGTAAEVTSTAAKNAGILATTRHRIATLASAAAQKVVAAATVIWTGVQKALNLAMRANPIGLVITAIALLVGGIVLAYQRSETFRGIVNKLWAALKSGAISAASAVLGMVDGMLGALSTLLGAMGKLPGPLGKPFRDAADKIEGARGKVKGLQDSINGLRGKTVPVSVDMKAFDRTYGQSYRLPGEVVQRRAFGGRIQGYSPGDRSDNIPAMVTADEFVIQRPRVRELDRQFPGFLERLNAGQINLGGDPGNTIVSVGQKVRGQQATGSLPRFADGGRVAAAQSFARQQLGEPYVWGGTGPQGWDCSGFAGGAYAILTGKNPNSRYFTTDSIGAAQGFRPGKGVFTIGVTPGRGHMAFNVGGEAFEATPPRLRGGKAAAPVTSFARQFYLPEFGGQFMGQPGLTKAQMAAVVRANGPRIMTGVARDMGFRVMDQGGQLAPGWNPPVFNGTGRPETVNTARSMDEVVAELRALRRQMANIPVARVDGRVIKREYDTQTTRNPSGW